MFEHVRKGRNTALRLCECDSCTQRTRPMSHAVGVPSCAFCRQLVRPAFMSKKEYNIRVQRKAQAVGGTQPASSSLWSKQGNSTAVKYSLCPSPPGRSCCHWLYPQLAKQCFVSWDYKQWRHERLGGDEHNELFTAVLASRLLHMEERQMMYSFLDTNTGRTSCRQNAHEGTPTAWLIGRVRCAHESHSYRRSAVFQPLRACSNKTCHRLTR